MTEKTTSKDQLLARYAAGYGQLSELLEGLSESDLNRAVAADQWPIRKIVHHLADGEPVYGLLIKIAVGTPGSKVRLGDYPGNEPWSEALHWANRAIEPAVALFKAQREDTTALLRQRPDAWDQQIRFEMPQEQDEISMTVTQMIQVLVDHLDEHAAEIEDIRKKHNL
ncbi:MAG: DinB family protein [Chloroflexota bacterium]|nr:DinB family protein [Chloroflexota bacterium]